MLKRHRLGEAGEEIAARRLADLGYLVLERRFACRRGDIDIVCSRSDEVILVEVKTRSGASFGIGAETITESKRRALRACAGEYRLMTGWRGPIRFQVVFVELGYAGGEPVRFEVLTDAIA